MNGEGKLKSRVKTDLPKGGNTQFSKLCGLPVCVCVCFRLGIYFIFKHLCRSDSMSSSNVK